MPRPPRLAKLLVRLFASRERNDAYLGDIEEIFAEMASTRGTLRSRAWYWAEALGSLPSYLENTLIWSWIMFKTNLKIAVRNLKKHLGYSALNIAGLALGMACALFILLWVQDELSFDRFHANAKTLYRIEQDQTMSQGVFHHSSTPYGMREALKAEIPEILDASRFFGGRTFLVRQGEKAFFETRFMAVDPSFLKMFSFPVIRGDAETALADPGSVVLTESLARKYFGADDPIRLGTTRASGTPCAGTRRRNPLRRHALRAVARRTKRHAPAREACDSSRGGCAGAQRRDHVGGAGGEGDRPAAEA